MALALQQNSAVYTKKASCSSCSSLRSKSESLFSLIAVLFDVHRFGKLPYSVRLLTKTFFGSAPRSLPLKPLISRWRLLSRRRPSKVPTSHNLQISLLFRLVIILPNRPHLGEVSLRLQEDKPEEANKALTFRHFLVRVGMSLT